jgi:pimeloyl-ACP methyl ester carboxylesterase
MANYLLLHCGAAGSWMWRPVERLLRDRGHQVWTVTYTGFAERRHLNSKDVTPQTHVADVVNTIHFEDIEDCIIVAHSYSGSIAPGVARQVPDKISKLIYLDALVVNEGEATNVAMGFMNAEQADGMLEMVQRGEAPISSGVADMQRKDAEQNPYRMSADRQQWVLDHLDEMPMSCGLSPVKVGAGSLDKPVEYIACTDTIMGPMHERAKALGWPVHELDGDHVVLVGNPEGTADLIEQLSK